MLKRYKIFFATLREVLNDAFDDTPEKGLFWLAVLVVFGAVLVEMARWLFR